MIYLTAGLVPSTLFHTQGCSAFLVRMLQETERLREEGDLDTALQRAEEAHRYSRDESFAVGRALASLEMSDIHREDGRLGVALDWAKKAQRILDIAPGAAQRHNEAVAAYNLGLLHHLLGTKVEALRWYETAMKQLYVAHEHWRAHKEHSWARKCSRLGQWVNNLRNCLLGEEGGLYSTLIVPAWLLGDTSSPFCVAEVEVKGSPLLTRRVMINGRTFSVHSLPEGDSILLSRGKYRILHVPARHRTQVGVQKDDLVLARCPDEPLQTPYWYIRQHDNGLEFGRFERDAQGAFRFVLDAPRIIGGTMSDTDEVLYPVALLKPEDGKD